MGRIGRYGKRTLAGRKSLPAGVLFLLGLTVTLVFSHRGKEEAPSLSYDDTYPIRRESLAGSEEISLEEYLTGALAAVVAEDFEAEACKAQAVVLRTGVERALAEEESGVVEYEKLKQQSLTMEEMWEKWGGDDSGIWEKLHAAVTDTAGITLHYNGRAAELAFFEVSAGRTRSGERLSNEETRPYLCSVACPEDIFAADCRQETLFRKKEAQRLLRGLFETDEDIAWRELSVCRDEAGYAEGIVWKEKEVSGEAFRKAFGLPSANLTIEEKEKGILFITKGIGHGMGMSLYTANEMAKEGADFREILQYFFPGCEIVKN